MSCTFEQRLKLEDLGRLLHPQCSFTQDLPALKVVAKPHDAPQKEQCIQQRRFARPVRAKNELLASRLVLEIDKAPKVVDVNASQHRP